MSPPLGLDVGNRVAQRTCHRPSMTYERVPHSAEGTVTRRSTFVGRRRYRHLWTACLYADYDDDDRCPVTASPLTHGREEVSPKTPACEYARATDQCGTFSLYRWFACGNDFDYLGHWPEAKPCVMGGGDVLNCE